MQENHTCSILQGRVEGRAVAFLRKFLLPCSSRAKDKTLLPSTAIPSPAPGERSPCSGARCRFSSKAASGRSWELFSSGFGRSPQTPGICRAEFASSSSCPGELVSSLSLIPARMEVTGRDCSASRAGKFQEAQILDSQKLQPC